MEYMTGFRMSFRTEAIRIVGFDEILKKYSLCEDIDASFGVWKHGWVVGAKRAKVYHHRSPEPRGNNTEMGIIQVLNKAYVIVKRTQPDDRFRRALRTFIRSKAWITELTDRARSGRARVKGINAGIAVLPRLMQARPEQASEAYSTALKMAICRVDG